VPRHQEENRGPPIEAERLACVCGDCGDAEHKDSQLIMFLPERDAPFPAGYAFDCPVLMTHRPAAQLLRQADAMLGAHVVV
jgi:hypothetical protein